MAVHDNILHVSWDPPLSPRGVLTGYKILVKNLIDFGESVYSVSVYVYELNITLGICEFTKNVHKHTIVVLKVMYNLSLFFITNRPICQI